jgi:hypothetical protein
MNRRRAFVAIDLNIGGMAVEEVVSHRQRPVGVELTVCLLERVSSSNLSATSPLLITSHVFEDFVIDVNY